METPKNPHSLNYRIREGLSRIAMVMRVDDWNIAKAAGLNPTQVAILSLLAAREATGLTVKEIASHLGVSQPTATDSINVLERKGYLRKAPDPKDGRAVCITLTSQGSDVLATDEADDGLAAAAVDALDAREQEDLLISLIKMIRHLQVRDSIPVQRMCVTCRFFSPYAHPDSRRPHHCHFVDAPFGQPEIRVDCRDHREADLVTRAAAWAAFEKASPAPGPGNREE
ncbi:MarR family winged helix-turn-helix transcriptional regulator [Rhizobium metallidurans]|uniref:DNA-binding MarR family transcriptional regulator n=1 Tax=Rhizobium metallidurans TaxID=1265931 RepID=A0A7W6GDX5_9HYPH|nr:MarR family transcriptional regulator [Rhizobium metallidurans]MBB3966101.1 DNA-binding MarR family transcriptional regulator [Rhizobium metallidurans]